VFQFYRPKFKDKPDYVWFICTVNAYYDLAVSHWCKIFGSYPESTHYHHLLETQLLKTKLLELSINPVDKEHLKHAILSGCDLQSSDYDNYHQLTKEYRDRNLIHREHSPSEINDGDLYFPNLEIAKQTLLSLTLILIKLAKRFPETQDEVNCFKFLYDDIDSQEKISTLIMGSFPIFS
jgi:hypothetical protein